MTKHSGSCLCGTVTFLIEGEFSGFYLCHCKYCRKDTGSAHAANLFAQPARLTWLTGESDVSSYRLPGTRHCKSFCNHCGSALPSVQISEAFAVVPAGSLDGDIALKPTAHIFTCSRANWDSALENIPQFERMPE